MCAIQQDEEPWVGLHVYFDEAGNSPNDPNQKVFVFAGLAFASPLHRDSVLKEAEGLGLIGPNARNPRSRARETELLDGLFGILNPGGSSALTEDKVLLTVSHVDLTDKGIRRLLDEGKRSAQLDGVAYIFRDNDVPPGINWLWISSALQALVVMISHVVAGTGQYIAQLHIWFDERTLDSASARVFRGVMEKRFPGKAFIQGLRHRFSARQWAALESRVDIQELHVRPASDSTNGAVRLAHWLARAAFRCLNTAREYEGPDWVARIRQEHGPNAVRDITSTIV